MVQVSLELGVLVGDADAEAVRELAAEPPDTARITSATPDSTDAGGGLELRTAVRRR